MEIANVRQAYAQLIDGLQPYLKESEGRALVRLLNRTSNFCTHQNVQLCKRYILKYVAASSSRTAALFEYLVALSKSLAPRPLDWKLAGLSSSDENDGLKFTQADGMQQPPLSAAKRMHIVYIVHDILATASHWSSSGSCPLQLDASQISDLLVKGQKALLTLFELAASSGFHRDDQPQVQVMLKLIAQWRAIGFFSPKELDRLNSMANSAKTRPFEETLKSVKLAEAQDAADRKRAAQEAHRWILPHSHGVRDDRDAPWHELPAANGLYLKNTRGFPLRAGGLPKGGFPVRGGSQDASIDLQKDVKWLHAEMLHCFDDHTDAAAVLDIDPMGNKIWKDPERPTRNYYGFTYDGVAKAQANRKTFEDNALGYAGIPFIEGGGVGDVSTAIERARALAFGRGGFGDRAGFSERGGFGDRSSYMGRGGFDDRGGYGGRGGFDDQDGRGRGGRGSGGWYNGRGGPAGDRGGYRGDGFKGGRGGITGGGRPFY